MADETNETEAAEGVLDENQNIVTEDEIKVDDGASMAEIAAAHAQALEDEKQVSLEDIDGVEGARRQDAGDAADAGEASSGGTVMDGAAAAATAEAPSLGRKVREGLVASTKMDKTAIVVAQDRVRHRRYNKTMQRDKRLYVHDEENDMNVGDRVRVIETRPLSKNKRWRLLEIVERAR